MPLHTLSELESFEHFQRGVIYIRNYDCRRIYSQMKLLSKCYTKVLLVLERGRQISLQRCLQNSLEDLVMSLIDLYLPSLMF